jgi:small subunit ribosomal protein S4e
LGKKGERKHLKRKPAPKMWPIHRKEAVWTVKPNPGHHSLSNSLPLELIVRDMLKLAKTGKEAKNIISQEKITIDGKVRRDERFLVGLMDVISIVDAKKSYRVLPSKKGLFLHPIKSDETAFKLYRVEDKTVVKGGKVQLDFHDGTSNLLSGEDVYKTLDVLKLSVPERELIRHVELTVGAPAIVTGGKNIGKYGKIVSIEKKPNQKRRDLIVTLEDVNGGQFQTILDFVFILGDAEPFISLPEAD